MSPNTPFPPPTPTPKTNWADDDDDDFDFASWVATADTSAPLLSSLPPLQLPADEDEMSFTCTISTPSGESAPWAAPSPLPCTPDWRCGAAMLAWRATQKAPGVPAYVEMSGWDNGEACEWRRVQYSQHWGNWKVGGGLDCRRTAMFRGSRLRVEEVVEEEDCARERGEMDSLLTIVTDMDALKSLRVPDEGYYTDDSPLVSPTGGLGAEGGGVSVSTSQVGLAALRTFTRHRRVDSQDALKQIKKVDESGIDGGETAEEELEIALDGDGGDGGLLDDISMRLSDAAATSWYFVANQPWATAGAVTSSIVLGGSIYFLRKG